MFIDLELGGDDLTAPGGRGARRRTLGWFLALLIPVTGLFGFIIARLGDLPAGVLSDVGPRRAGPMAVSPQSGLGICLHARPRRRAGRAISRPACCRASSTCPGPYR